MNNFMKTAFALTALAASGGAYASPVSVLDVSNLSVATVGQGTVILKSTQSQASQSWFGLDLSNHAAGNVGVDFTLENTDRPDQAVSYTLYSLPAGVTSFDANDPSAVLGSPYKPTFSLTNAAGGISSLTVMLTGGLEYLLDINVGSGNSFTGIGDAPSSVPLPGAALLFGTALLGAGALRRRGRKSREMGAGPAIAAA